MLEFDDIQYILLARVPALTGRYEFLSFQQPAQGRAVARCHTGEGTVGQGGHRYRQSLKKMGLRCVHVERFARTRGGRGVTRDISRGISARHGGSVAGPR